MMDRRWRSITRIMSTSSGPAGEGCQRRADDGVVLCIVERRRRFTARERIPTEGMPHHPQIAIASDGSLAMAWDGLLNGTRRAVVARVMFDATGRPRFDRLVASGDGPAVYPIVAVAGDATIAAWT